MVGWSTKRTKQLAGNFKLHGDPISWYPLAGLDDISPQFPVNYGELLCKEVLPTLQPATATFDSISRPMLIWKTSVNLSHSSDLNGK